MKVKNLIKQFEQYNQEADVFVNSNFKDIGFTIAYGGGEGVEKENCETVSIYPDNLGAENTNNCASMIYNPKDWGATLGVDSSRINLGYESMQGTLLGKTISKKDADKDSFEDVTKYKKERSYSEEEIAIAFNEGQAYSVTGKLVDGKEWVKTHKKEWFETFNK
jgi:hypothetical protein